MRPFLAIFENFEIGANDSIGFLFGHSLILAHLDFRFSSIRTRRAGLKKILQFNHPAQARTFRGGIYDGEIFERDPPIHFRIPILAYTIGEIL